jgi:predicted porin
MSYKSDKKGLAAAAAFALALGTLVSWVTIYERSGSLVEPQTTGSGTGGNFGQSGLATNHFDDGSRTHHSRFGMVGRRLRTESISW